MFYFVFQSTFIMENQNTSLEDLRTIRKLMEESTRFISLSGLSGIFAGTFAIAGAYIANYIVQKNTSMSFAELFGTPAMKAGTAGVPLIILAAVILILSVVSALYFSIRKAHIAGRNIWSPVSKRMLANLCIPLAAGGIFVLILILNGNLQLIIPSMLIFYGLSLVSASKFTYGEVMYLGLAELITGFIPAFFPSASFASWITGFGLLHIIYGIALYRKYEA
jgi:hypothetical protein